jgi:hypothetical protein
MGASNNKKGRRYFLSAIDNAQSASGQKIDGLKVPQSAIADCSAIDNVQLVGELSAKSTK